MRKGERQKPRNGSLYAEKRAKKTQKTGLVREELKWSLVEKWVGMSSAAGNQVSIQGEEKSEGIRQLGKITCLEKERSWQ